MAQQHGLRYKGEAIGANAVGERLMNMTDIAEIYEPENQALITGGMTVGTDQDNDYLKPYLASLTPSSLFIIQWNY